MCKKDQRRNNPTQAHLESNVSMHTRCDIMPLVADMSSEGMWNFVCKKDQRRNNPTQAHLESTVSMHTRCDIMPLVADMSREKVFLDRLAGSSSSSASRKRPASNQSDSAPPRVANEGEVDVGQDLLDMMQTEVEEACALLKSTAGQTFRPTTCPCCPWRRFDKRAHLIRHLQFQHVTSKRFCPSGTKQLRIAVSIYDQDALRGKVMEPNFLSRSAAIMRADVLPPIPTKYVFVDKTVRYVFIETGPIIMALHTIKSRSDLRRLGNLYYNRGFACLFLKAAATNNASLHRIYTDVIGSCTRHEGQLVSLVPRATNGFWTNVMEDLMQSPSLVSYREGLFTQCFENEEFDYISIDATFKINLKVIGQANFHSSQSSRDAAAIPESEAAYRTLTCRGRTGATLLVRVVRSEKSLCGCSDASRGTTTAPP